MPVGALIWGFISGQGRNDPRTCMVCVLAAVGRELLRTIVSTPPVSLTRREKGLTWCMKYRAGVGCAGNDACPEGCLGAYIKRLILSEKDLSLS